MSFWFKALLEVPLRNYTFFEADLLATTAQKTNHDGFSLYVSVGDGRGNQVISKVLSVKASHSCPDPLLFTKLPVYLGVGVDLCLLIF